MVDTKSPGDKTLSVPTKTLTLKPRVETGTVKQSFSHGRTKQVVVEKRGKRRVGGDAPATDTHAPEPVVAKAAPAKAPLARPATPAAAPRSSPARSFGAGAASRRAATPIAIQRAPKRIVFWALSGSSTPASRNSAANHRSRASQSLETEVRCCQAPSSS